MRAVADALVDGRPVQTGERWAVPITREALARVGAQLRNAAARWDQVPEGGTLAMTWSSRAS